MQVPRKNRESNGLCESRAADRGTARAPDMAPKTAYEAEINAAVCGSRDSQTLREMAPGLQTRARRNQQAGKTRKKKRKHRPLYKEAVGMLVNESTNKPKEWLRTEPMQM